MKALFRGICLYASTCGTKITQAEDGTITITWPTHTPSPDIISLAFTGNAGSDFFHKDDIAACAKEIKALLTDLTSVWNLGLNLTLVIGTNGHLRLHTPNYPCFATVNALVQSVNARMLHCPPPKSDRSWRTLTLQNFGWLPKAAA